MNPLLSVPDPGLGCMLIPFFSPWSKHKKVLLIPGIELFHVKFTKLLWNLCLPNGASGWFQSRVKSPRQEPNSQEKDQRPNSRRVSYFPRLILAWQTAGQSSSSAETGRTCERGRPSERLFQDTDRSPKWGGVRRETDGSLPSLSLCSDLTGLSL